MSQVATNAGGYVTDLPYQFRYHRELNPALQAFMIAAQGRVPSFPAHGALTYLDLGCGFGLSTLVHAAGNPDARFVAVDFNAQHIATARWLATSAGLDNVEFLQIDFADLERRTLPDFDLIAAHGLWSWVDAVTRDRLVRFLDRKLKDGGAFYLSYNALPAMAPLLPARRLMWDAFRAASGTTAERIEAAKVRARAVMAADCAYIAANPRTAQMLERALEAAPNYLAHEYFNDTWDAFYHADVAASLAPVGLRYVGSAHVLSNMDRLNLTPAAETALAAVADPTARETLRDYFVLQDFRRDLFVRNLPPAADMTAALNGWRFAGLADAAAVDDIAATTILGEVRPLRGTSEPVLRALARGPGSVLSLLGTSECAGIGAADLFDVLLVLTALGAAEPAAPAQGLAARKARTDRLNAALWEFALQGDMISVSSSPVTGGGVGVPQVDQLFLLARHRGEDPVAFLRRTFGANVEGDLEAGYAHFTAHRLPLLQRLGIGGP